MTDYRPALLVMVAAIGLFFVLNPRTSFPEVIEIGNGNTAAFSTHVGSESLENNRDVVQGKQLKNCEAAQLQGHRPYQEDRILCTPDMFMTSGMNVSLFGVFDGHGGHEASEWASSKLRSRFLHHFQARTVASILSTHEPSSPLLDGSFNNSSLAKQLREALADAISDIESTILAEAVEKDLKSGSTASLVLQAATHILVANIGDSKALLCPAVACSPTPLPASTRRERRLHGNGERRPVEDVCGHGQDSLVVELSHDHRPDREDEQLRIESAGGFVETYGGLPRVNGQLAVSRSTGDPKFKKCGLVTADPEWTGWLDMGSTKSHLVMASDGVFERLTIHEVCSVVSGAMSGVDVVKALGFSSQAVYEPPIALQPLEKQSPLPDEETLHESEIKRTELRQAAQKAVIQQVNTESQEDLRNGAVQHDATHVSSVVASAIVEAALRSGSKDNLSALVIVFSHTRGKQN